MERIIPQGPVWEKLKPQGLTGIKTQKIIPPKPPVFEYDSVGLAFGLYNKFRFLFGLQEI